MSSKPRIDSRLPALAASTLVLALCLGSPAAADPEHPIQVVAAFLELAPDQVEAVIAIRTIANEAAAPLAQEIAARRAALEELLATPEPDPAVAGVLVITISRLGHKVELIQQQATAEIESILSPEQAEKLETLRAVPPFCTVLPAFKVLYLV